MFLLSSLDLRTQEILSTRKLAERISVSSDDKGIKSARKKISEDLKDHPQVDKNLSEEGKRFYLVATRQLDPRTKMFSFCEILPLIVPLSLNRQRIGFRRNFPVNANSLLPERQIDREKLESCVIPLISFK